MRALFRVGIRSLMPDTKSEVNPGFTTCDTLLRDHRFARLAPSQPSAGGDLTHGSQFSSEA
jgi:hypothetical protein